ncbi:MAG TPA: glycogen debranching N-terminal domain-containing protein [Polyangiaceae bacterium]|nr:glycogen debranching N-terminal domain-containing protein [Polyangiaceae bacterium]
MNNGRVSILDGNTFVVSDQRGDMEGIPGDDAGLFHQDMRYLCRWVLTMNGKRPNMLSVDDFQYFRTQFFSTLSTGTVYVDSHLSCRRERTLDSGFREKITIQNHGKESMDLDVFIEAAADFADLFEVKDHLTKKGQLYHRVDGAGLIFGYRRERFIRETVISANKQATFSPDGVRFHVQLPPHGEWDVELDVRAVNADAVVPATNNGPGAREKVDERLTKSVKEWLDKAPRLVSDWAPLERTYRRSLVDLAALRVNSPLAPGRPVPAAGLPWFMAMFGRDSLITSFQALPFAPELAEATLRTLGALQARTTDPFRDAEPGKILHELRLGELTAFEERPHSPYFGSADATPLFLILLEEYERWTGNRELVRVLEREVRAAVRWMDEYGDRDGDGFIEYERRNTETGLENQCWKDSWDSIAFADGELAPTPRATCELQGYAYDAKLRTARLARVVLGDPAWANELERSAEALKERFNREFWLPERGFFALALDGKKRKVDALTSNIGHLLWSGIADPEKAKSCVDHLMSDPLFSGWGVRTMATTEGSYNPIGYHVGTVWPHDCSIIAWGLRRAGYRAEAARLSRAILEAAEFFHYRLPEAFAGYPRADTRFPVEYPTACSPQAWASGAPLLVLRALLGLEAEEGRLIVDPAIPHPLEELELLDIRGPWDKADAFGRARFDVAA